MKFSYRYGRFENERMLLSCWYCFDQDCGQGHGLGLSFGLIQSQENAMMRFVFLSYFFTSQPTLN